MFLSNTDRNEQVLPRSMVDDFILKSLRSLKKPIVYADRQPLPTYLPPAT
jgi:hypothetical protein